MSERYLYRSLSSSTSIRLLHGCGVPEISRKPVQEIDGFPIFGPEQYTTQEYYLQEVDLDSNPEFEALSYTWKDDPMQTTSSWETITCDGREMAITDGLGNALRRLSTIKRDVPIWIDAICINQENTTERSNQVNMMERIYSAARTVVIWLGPTLTPRTWYFSGPQVSIQLMEDLPRLDASSSDNPLDFRRTAGALKGFGVSLVDLIALADFFGRPWFSRVWTIQELLLANEIVVYWGPFEIEWKTLYNTALVVSIFFQYTEVSGVIRRADQKWIDGARMHVLLKRLDQPLSKEPLDYYFDLSRSHAATDPRDKVFALLALAEPGTVPFEADYSLPVEMVYMACASYVMRGRTGLQLLSMVEDKAERKLSGLPSWVPDLTVAARARRLRFHRAPARESQRHEIKGSSLVIEASSCATVEAVAEGLEEIMDELWPLDLLRMLSSFGPVYATGERTLDVLCQTLAAPVVGPQEVDAELLRKGFDHWLVMQFMLSIAWADGYLESSGHFLSRFLTGSATARGKNRDSLPGNWSESLRDALHTFGRVFADEINIEEKIASIEATLKESWGKKDHKEISDKLRKPLNMFDSRFFRSYKGRRLFRTKEGFAGLGPESTKPGDEFFLLANAHVPFVLRSVSSGGYELVGEAYVHGFMKGQALQEVGRQMNRIEII